MWRTTSSPRTSELICRFQSTSSVWRTTKTQKVIHARVAISIHVLRVEDDPKMTERAAQVIISIHVLRVEDDKRQLSGWAPSGNFNPRPPCGGRPGVGPSWGFRVDFNPRPPCGGRLEADAPETQKPEFQSTSSVWRTTPAM